MAKKFTLLMSNQHWLAFKRLPFDLPWESGRDKEAGTATLSAAELSALEDNIYREAVMGPALKPSAPPQPQAKDTGRKSIFRFFLR